MKRTYEVEMTVPLGLRRGRLFLEEENSQVSGVLDILGNKTTFDGKLDGSRISIRGELKISVRSIAYQGDGKLEDKELWIQMKGKNSLYVLRGTLQKECEED